MNGYNEINRFLRICYNLRVFYKRSKMGLCLEEKHFMLHLIRFAIMCLRIVYVPFKLILKPQNKITMLSRQSNSIPVSYQLIEKSLRERNSEINIVILAKKLEGNLLNKIGYCFHILQQMYHIATSKIIIVDGYCIPVSVLTHKTEQIFVQTWHALNIIKKFGYLSLDRPSGTKKEVAEVMCMHRNYTHILCAGKITGELLKKSFESPKSEILTFGLPYVDYILSPQQIIVDDMRRSYPQLKQKKNILYVPTFRKKRCIDLNWISEKLDLEKYNVIVKLHPVDREGVRGSIDSRIILDEKFTTHQWFWISDYVITDYSGVGIEAALLDKKLYFYLFDKKQYEEEVGLNVNLYEEPIAKYVTESVDDLVEMLEDEYEFELLKQYREKYIDANLCDCSGQFAEWLLEKTKEVK